MATSTGATASCAAVKPALFATQPVAGLFETDVSTHQKLEAVRALGVDDPHPEVITGGDLYLTYGDAGKYDCSRIARVPLSGGHVAQSPWLHLSASFIVAYGSVWVLGYPSPKSDAQVLYQLSVRTLAIRREIPLGSRFGGWEPAASAGAVWLGSSDGTELGRVDARTGRLTLVKLPGFSKGQSIWNVVSGPGTDTLYISAVNQMAATWSQKTERFHPRTGQFEVEASTERFMIVGLIGVAGTLLWVSLQGGMMGHVGPLSAVTMTPTHCATESTCTFNGWNGTFAVTTAGNRLESRPRVAATYKPRTTRILRRATTAPSRHRARATCSPACSRTRVRSVPHTRRSKLLSDRQKTSPPSRLSTRRSPAWVNSNAGTSCSIGRDSVLTHSSRYAGAPPTARCSPRFEMPRRAASTWSERFPRSSRFVRSRRRTIPQPSCMVGWSAGYKAPGRRDGSVRTSSRG